MCRATLLPDPDRPLRMTMRTGLCSSSSGCAASAGALNLRSRRAPPLRRVIVGALFLVLLDAAVELVGQQIDGRVHVLFGRVRVDRVAAHVQRRLGLLSQLLYRQYAVHVDDAVEMSADTLELLFHITAQRCSDLDVMPGDVELHGPSPFLSVFQS